MRDELKQMAAGGGRKDNTVECSFNEEDEKRGDGVGLGQSERWLHAHTPVSTVHTHPSTRS